MERRFAGRESMLKKICAFPASKIVLGLIIGLALFSLWQVFFVPYHNVSLLSFRQERANTELQIPALQNRGVSLGYATQVPMISQAQAIVLANQLEPTAAVNAKKIAGRYILLNYTANSETTPTRFTNQSAWCIWYQSVPLQVDNTAVDGTSSSPVQQDIYVFLDDRTGRELVVFWV
jgi:hypothetical protein